MDAEDLRAQGRRMTVQRALIVQLIEEADGHIAPEELYQRAREYVQTINRSTVYRNLWALEEMGIVRHVHDGTGAERYHLNTEPPHIHLYCHRCGHLAEVADLEVADETARALLERYGFVADTTHFPIAGLCAHCAESD